MHKTAHGMRSSYKAGCRCDLCKQAESTYRRQLRQRHREDVGLFTARSVTGLSLVNGAAEYPISGSVNTAGLVESAVSEEIAAMGTQTRPGLAAVALALARVLDNPKAVSTQPAAARVLITTLDRLHSSLTQPRGRLATVRALTGEVLGKPQGA